jgi:hypothetical protein
MLDERRPRKNNKEAGQKRPGGFAPLDPGLGSGASPKNHLEKANPRQAVLARRGFGKADSSEPAPVASALDLRSGRDPDAKPLTLPRTHLHSVSWQG